MDFEKIVNSDIIRLKDQKLNKKLTINFFRSIKTKQIGEQYLLYNKKYNKSFFSNKQIYSYLSKISNLQQEDGFYYKDEQLSDILTFKITKIENNCVSVTFINDNSKYKSEILPLSDNEQ